MRSVKAARVLPLWLLAACATRGPEVLASGRARAETSALPSPNLAAPTSVAPLPSTRGEAPLPRASGPSSPSPISAQPAGLAGDDQIDWQQNRVMRVLGRITETLQSSTYSHAMLVNPERGIYRFDCSTMVSWVLGRAAPVAARGFGQRPLARDFQRRIAAVPPGEERQGWQRVARVEDARPGDVVAWIKPEIIRSPNTGHVAFLVQPPVRLPGEGRTFLARVADATSLLHDDDTRLDRTGFGLGTIVLVSDQNSGAPIAYGWSGLKWRTFEAAIAIGRPTR